MLDGRTMRMIWATRNPVLTRQVRVYRVSCRTFAASSPVLYSGSQHYLVHPTELEEPNFVFFVPLVLSMLVGRLSSWRYILKLPSSAVADKSSLQEYVCGFTPVRVIVATS